jgi:hypothetical protein
MYRLVVPTGTLGSSMGYFKRKISIFLSEVMYKWDGKKDTREARDPEFTTAWSITPNPELALHQVTSTIMSHSTPTHYKQRDISNLLNVINHSSSKDDHLILILIGDSVKYIVTCQQSQQPCVVDKSCIGLANCWDMPCTTRQWLLSCLY